MMTSQDRSPNSATAESSQSFYDWLVKSKSIVISILVLFILISSIVIALVYRQYKNAGADLLSADKTSANQIAGSSSNTATAAVEKALSSQIAANTASSTSSYDSYGYASYASSTASATSIPSFLNLFA